MSKVDHELVYIVWLDHCTFGEHRWRSREDTLKLRPVKMYSVGWILKETKKYIVLVSTHNTSDHFENELLIMKGCITKRKRLTDKK